MFGHAVDIAELEARLSSFFLAQHHTTERPRDGRMTLAIDGKTLRGTIPSGHGQSVHLLAAYLPDAGVVGVHPFYRTTGDGCFLWVV